MNVRLPSVISGIVIILIIFACDSQSCYAKNVLVNPSFEIDNNGIPANWEVPKDVQVKLVDKAVDGKKAAAFSSGYLLISQDVEIPNLANTKITLSFSACGADGATLGVLMGYNHKSPDGVTTKWVQSQLLWDRLLSADFEPTSIEYQFPPQASGSRVWIGLYRTNKKGTLFIDNFVMTLGEASPEKAKSFNRIERQWRYFKERALKTRRIAPNSAKIDGMVREASEIQSRCMSNDATLLERKENLDERIGVFSAQLNKILNPGTDVVVCFSDPYVRLRPTDIISDKLPGKQEIITLPLEYQAIGVIITNCKPEPVTCQICLKGIDVNEFNCEIRKQVFLETWYKREKEVLADPLPLLKRENGFWKLNLNSGEIAKLYIGIVSPEKSAGKTTEVHIDVNNMQGSSAQVIASIQILAASVPDVKRFKYIAFMYPEINPSGHFPEIVAKDLALHGVTAIEFPYIPKATFTSKGEIVSIDFSQHDKWMLAYGPYIEQLTIFWEGMFKEFKCVDGNSLEFLSESWKTAYCNLLRRWLDHARDKGFPISHFSILAVDEPYSRSYQTAPDKFMADTIEIYALTKKVASDIPLIATLCDYTLPQDVNAMLPYIDVAVQAWPPRDVKLSNTPPDTTPRKMFYNHVYPAINKWRQNSKKQIWSYHVAGGKSDDVLLGNRAYPVLAVGDGLTGGGHWAYNVSSGSTWDDTDGTSIDSILVYDGSENNQTNLMINPTKEIVVPSIRWQALRAGIQDAEIMLYLKDNLANFNPKVRGEIVQILNEANLMAKDIAQIKGWEGWMEIENYNGTVTSAHISDFASRLRVLYQKACNSLVASR